ncbi:aspartyl-phosphate phosphatase Spo0E family protein [Priestia aryabhattai]|uniref:aspartyl-phosphate phosphatase Spo0E family protein n=1 Tax=Priestia aryabhattai TaxID=412384 RepID=UPI001D7A33EE|nr:aspartyl-phosphate phosphatase Spo0E family protein [Priestia aryabhattai]MBX9968899.1 aspartyl-phosphate phosphatase Spo0E family protein [Priestia aryabhattai]
MDGYKTLTKWILITEIEITRERMIVTGLEEGFNSNNTIKISEVMDQLLNELQKVDK